MFEEFAGLSERVKPHVRAFQFIIRCIDLYFYDPTGAGVLVVPGLLLARTTAITARLASRLLGQCYQPIPVSLVFFQRFQVLVFCLTQLLQG